MKKKTMLLTLAVLPLLNSCGLTVSPDGSKNFSVDAAAGYKALEIIAAK